MPKETGEKLIVQNKKARHDYAIEDKYAARCGWRARTSPNT